MKFFAVLALAAVAFAEPEAEGKADARLLYGSYGYPYAGVYGGYRAYGAYPATYGYGYRTYGYGKRSADAQPEAEAEAEADPALLYGSYGYPYAGVYGGYRAYGAYPATYGYGYRTYGAYPYSYYGKRSADAQPEAEADAEADPALLYGSYGYPYAGVYGGYRAYGAYPATYGYGYRTYGAYPYSYYGKRSADAEPEADAEADPALLYSTSSVVAPLTTAYTHAVAAPLTYTHAVAAPLTTAYTHVAAPTAVKTVVPTYGQYSIPSTGYYAGYPIYTKRSADAEAEADPALVYANTLASSVYNYAPLTYTHAVPQVATQYAVPVATVAKAPAHGVAATYAGLVHSSHVGVCLNNVGVQVPC